MQIANRQTFRRRVTPLEWIEATGTQYLDTGLVPDAACVYTLDFQFTAHLSSYRCVLGSQPPSSAQYAMRLILRDYNGAFMGYSNTGRYTVKSPSDLNRHTFVFDLPRQRFVFDGAVTNSNISKPAGGGLAMAIFANKTGATNVLEECAARVWSLRVESGGTVTHLFRPAKCAGEIGMLDVVTGEWHGNLGSGSFIAGPRGGSFNA